MHQKCIILWEIHIFSQHPTTPNYFSLRFSELLSDDDEGSHGGIDLFIFWPNRPHFEAHPTWQGASIQFSPHLTLNLKVRFCWGAKIQSWHLAAQNLVRIVPQFLDALVSLQVSPLCQSGQPGQPMSLTSRVSRSAQTARPARRSSQPGQLVSPVSLSTWPLGSAQTKSSHW